jgi:hypothetical protein
MYKRWIRYVTVFLTLTLTMVYAARVEAVLSYTEVVRGNMAQLQLIAEGESVRFPTVEKIDGVPVLAKARTQNTSLQIINGKSTLRHIYKLTLTFEPTKSMHIPSFDIEVDGKIYKTKPLTLKVVDSNAPVSAHGKPIQLVRLSRLLLASMASFCKSFRQLRCQKREYAYFWSARRLA